MTANPFVILYVEDNALVRESFAELLATDDRRILCVADCADARAALAGQVVNLLITDIDLPDGSGLELAQEALKQHPGLPVIFCSGQDLKSVARSFGPTAHALTKPIELDELEALVARLQQRAC